jgi:hypothetical protein
LDDRLIVPSLTKVDIDAIERTMLDQGQRRIADSAALRGRAEILIASGVEATAAFEQASRAATGDGGHPIPRRARELVRKGAPPMVAALALAFFSNVNASLTHYGTGPAPIFFGSGYVRLETWWRVGFFVVLFHFVVWLGLGLLWWRLLGLW